jgi:hypothetical protein
MIKKIEENPHADIFHVRSGYYNGVTNDICIHIVQLLLVGIYIHVFIMVIKCGCYPLFVYAVMIILDYYLIIYANLNNVVITICKFK